MSDTPKLYIAGMGMITPVGFDMASTAAAVKAGISSYMLSNYYDKDGSHITMTAVPAIIFDEINAEISGGNRHNMRHERVLKMAIIAIREACAQCEVKQPIPLLFAMPEGQTDTEGMSSIVKNLERNCKPWISENKYREISSGRAAGMDAINLTFQFLSGWSTDYVLIGGSDSYQDYSRISPLGAENRLLTKTNMDGFAPGEAAGFLLLTSKPELALEKNGNIIAINPPGIADETGHLSSVEPYRGDRLDQAFKRALVNQTEQNIHSIYSSMNGENYWAKEYGVAYIRNKASFAEKVTIEHPADIFGDIGSATSPVLIALAADNLYCHPTASSHLVYSSSDSAKRGAVVLEKMPAMAINSQGVSV